MADTAVIVMFWVVWAASVAPFILMAYEAKREARHLMDYIIAGQTSQSIHTGDCTVHATTPLGPATIELDRALRIYQSAIMRGEIGESDLDELARAGGVTEPVRQ